MSDLHSDLLTQEVDEEIRREKLRNFWKTYRKYVLGTAVGIVLVVAGREIYQYQVKAREEAASTAFSDAASGASAEGADAVTAWQEAVPGLKGNYKALGALKLAAAAADKGDVAGAVAAYDAIAAETGTDESLRDLAQLQAGMLLAGKGGDLAGARSRLGTVAVKGKAWYYSAQEQLALIDMQEGSLGAALEKFSLLADDAETPQSIRARAGQFRSFVEAKQAAEQPAPAEAPASEETSATGESAQ